MIDLYCERLGPGFWAEPVNALTNLGFLLSAYMISRIIIHHSRVPDHHRILILLCAAIGIGSFLFHTVATHWARWLDIIPILLFQLAFLWFYSTEVIRIPSVPTLAGLLIYLATALLSRKYPYILNGSLIYAPALITLMILGLWHYSNQVSSPAVLLSAAAVFLLSLTFRSLDNRICDVFPVGTHFLWHLLNALVVYLCALSLFPHKANKEIQT